MVLKDNRVLLHFRIPARGSDGTFLVAQGPSLSWFLLPTRQPAVWHRDQAVLSFVSLHLAHYPEHQTHSRMNESQTPKGPTVYVAHQSVNFMQKPEGVGR